MGSLLELWRKLIWERNVRTPERSVSRDRADRALQLNWRGRHRALTDAHRDRLAGIPLLLEVLDLPFFRWHYACHFLRKIHARLLPEAEQRRPFGDAADA